MLDMTKVRAASGCEDTIPVPKPSLWRKWAQTQKEDEQGKRKGQRGRGRREEKREERKERRKEKEKRERRCQ